MRNKWKAKLLLFFVVPGLLGTSGCANKQRTDISDYEKKAQQVQTECSTAPSESEMAQTISIPPFEGAVTEGETPLIDISDGAWEQARQSFQSKYPSLHDTIKNVKKSDFTLTDNWQGTLNEDEFSLNVYSCEAQYLLVVSKCGDNPAKIKLFLSGPKSVFAFYGGSIWLMQMTKGAGMPLSIATDESEEPSAVTENLNVEFDRLFLELSSMLPEKREAGTVLNIDGHSLLIVRGLTIAIADRDTP